MSDRIRQAMVYLIGMVMVAGVAAAPTVAQVYDPQAERVFEVTANADTVDGFSAIGATANKALRARKLVATNRYGQLPSNIIRPRWRDLKGVPAGFKDGVDNVGATTTMNLTFVKANLTIGPGSWDRVMVWCPAGSMLTGGGYGTPDPAVQITSSKPDTVSRRWWAVDALNNSATASFSVEGFAICMSTNPSWALGNK